MRFTLKNIFLLVLLSLVSCTDHKKKILIKNEEIQVNSQKEKNAYDQEYLGNLIDLEISEKDFLFIAKYIIGIAKKGNFEEIDR